MSTIDLEATGENADAPAEESTLPTYEIRTDLLAELDKRVAKANRRLARAGATDQFSYTVEEFVDERHNDAEDRTDYVQMARVTLSAPRITAPGYTFVAALTIPSRQRIAGLLSLPSRCSELPHPTTRETLAQGREGSPPSKHPPSPSRRKRQTCGPDTKG